MKVSRGSTGESELTLRPFSYNNKGFSARRSRLVSSPSEAAPLSLVAHHQRAAYESRGRLLERQRPILARLRLL